MALILILFSSSLEVTIILTFKIIDLPVTQICSLTVLEMRSPKSGLSLGQNQGIHRVGSLGLWEENPFWCFFSDSNNCHSWADGLFLHVSAAIIIFSYIVRYFSSFTFITFFFFNLALVLKGIYGSSRYSRIILPLNLITCAKSLTIWNDSHRF